MMNKIESLKREMREEMRAQLDINKIEDVIVDRYMEYPSSPVYIRVKDIAEKLGISGIAIQDNIDLILTIIIEKLHYGAIPLADDENIIESIEIKF